MSDGSRIGSRRTVGVWSRFLAQIADMLIVVIVASALVYFWAGLHQGGAPLTRMIDPSRPGDWMVVAIVGFLYFTVFEWRGGQTVGKILRGIEVQTLDGNDVGLWQALVRTLFRLIDGIAFYLVGALFVWTSPKRQRLGDRVARTTVLTALPEAAALRDDGTHPTDQEQPELFVPEVESEIGRPPPR